MNGSDPDVLAYDLRLGMLELRRFCTDQTRFTHDERKI